MIDWLIGTLIATSALMALLLVSRGAVRRLFGPAVAYGLWLIPAVRMILPPLERTVERPVAESLPIVAVQAPDLIAAPSALPAGGLFAELGGWPMILLALWLVGAAAMLVLGLWQYRAQRRAVLASAVQLARIGSVRLVRSEAVRGPMAFGIFDRVIIVPLDFEQCFSERQRRLALDHELAHHRSFDLVANLAAFVLLCLQWFNPLAWVAHSAFRFDQEAACDSRVLDKAAGDDRASYAEAIAKAASGRKVLFAGALDHPSTLSRRLQIMTMTSTLRARRLGFATIGGATLLALPLTASEAINYVDVAPVAPIAAAAQANPALAPRVAAQAAPTVAAAPMAAVAPVASVAAVQDKPYKLPGGVTLGKGDIAFFDNDRILIHGQVKTLDQMTAAERSELRATIAKSRRELTKERAELPARLAEAREELDHIRSGAFKRELIENRVDLRRDLAEVDSEAAELRGNGVDPEKIKAEIRQALHEVESIDIDKQVRDALAEIKPDQIAAELRNAEQQMVRLQSRLDQLDRR